MSNTDKSVAAPNGVVATRWWWVRHAPVREDGGRIYGQKDLGCDTSDRVVFAAVGKILPRNAVWFSSNLKRTHQTADAIWAAGFPKPATMPHEKAFAEMLLGKCGLLRHRSRLRKSGGPDRVSGLVRAFQIARNPHAMARQDFSNRFEHHAIAGVAAEILLAVDAAAVFAHRRMPHPPPARRYTAAGWFG